MAKRTWLFLSLALLALAAGSPVPNFGLPSRVSGSDQVSTATNETGTLLRTADDRLNTSLTSNYPKLAETLAQLAKLASFVAGIDTLMVAPLLTLTGDVSGDVRAQFGSVLGGINTTRGHMTQRVPSDLAALQTLLGESVPNRLKDGFGCVRTGLDRLGASLDALEVALLAAIAAAGSVNVPPAVLSRQVPLSAVLDVARTVIELKVCIPPIVETIDCTINNLKTADDYILSLRAMLAKIKSSAMI